MILIFREPSWYILVYLFDYYYTFICIFLKTVHGFDRRSHSNWFTLTVSFVMIAETQKP